MYVCVLSFSLMTQGGGHYVTTIRQTPSPFLPAIQKRQSSGSNPNLLSLAASTIGGLVGSTLTEEEQQDGDSGAAAVGVVREQDKDGKDKWFCLNDNLVTEVQDPMGEISGTTVLLPLLLLLQPQSSSYY